MKFPKLVAALPPFVFVLAFWQALTYVIAALLAAFTPYKVEAGVLLVLVLAFLKLFEIVPQFRAARLRRALAKKSLTYTKPE